jgi:hypothetical protein
MGISMLGSHILRCIHSKNAVFLQLRYRASRCLSAILHRRSALGPIAKERLLSEQDCAHPSGMAIRVRGLVQGVGFRPTVWRLAKRLGLSGEVLNNGEGMEAWASFIRSARSLAMTGCESFGAQSK